MEKTNNKGLVILAVIIMAAMMLQPSEKEGTRVRSTESGCEDSRQSSEDDGYCVSGCFLAAENVMKCNDYWAIKTGHSRGYSKSWLFNQDDVGEYYYMYEGSCPPYDSEWEKILYDCSMGAKTMPGYPACVEDTDCKSGQTCDIGIATCSGAGETHLECSNSVCTSVAGSGTNQCTPVGSVCGGSVCTPSWQCASWSTCSSGCTQTRTCTDSNNCGTTSGKPAVSQSCTGGDCTSSSTEIDWEKYIPYAIGFFAIIMFMMIMSSMGKKK